MEKHTGMLQWCIPHTTVDFLCATPEFSSLKDNNAIIPMASAVEICCDAHKICESWCRAPDDLTA